MGLTEQFELLIRQYQKAFFGIERFFAQTMVGEVGPLGRIQRAKKIENRMTKFLTKQPNKQKTKVTYPAGPGGPTVLFLPVPLLKSIKKINMSCTIKYIFTILHVMYYRVDITLINYSVLWSFLAIRFSIYANPVNLGGFVC